jgi:hypothetical protein
MKRKLPFLLLALALSTISLAPRAAALTCTTLCRAHQFLVCCPGPGCVIDGSC